MKRFGLMIFCFWCGFANAAPVVTPAAVPKTLHVYDAAGNTYVDMPAYDCSGSRYNLSPNHVKYDAIFSVLLAAQTANKKVMVRFDGCSAHASPQGQIVGVYLVD